MDNGIVNNCVVKEEVDLDTNYVKQEQEDKTIEEVIEIIEEETNFIESNCDLDTNYVKQEEKVIAEDVVEETVEEEETNFIENNCDQNENNVLHKPVEFINFDEDVDLPSNKSLESPLASSHRVRNGCQNKNCKSKCYEVSRHHKEAIFKHFWTALSVHEKLEFISCHICINSSVKRVRRNYFFKIDNKLKKVCYTTFIETLDISRAWIITALKKFQRKPNDSMSDFMSTVYKNFCDRGKEMTFFPDDDDGESDNYSEEDVEEEIVDCRTEFVRKELPLSGEKVKSPLQSVFKENDNQEFETVILDDDDANTSKDDKTIKIEEEEIQDIEKNLESCNNLPISRDDVFQDRITLSQEPCRVCSVCMFPQKHKQNIIDIFKKVKLYTDIIKYLKNCIRIMQSKEDKCKYIYEFFLVINDDKIKVCEYGLRNILPIKDEMLMTAMRMALCEFIQNSSRTKAEIKFDEQLTKLWAKAKRLHEHFYNKTKFQIEQNNGILTCEKECELYCQLTEKQWKEISNEFWKIDTIAELRKYISNHVQFLLAKAGKLARKHFLKIDGKLKRVCRLFFLEALSIKNEIIEAITKENNSKPNVILNHQELKSLIDNSDKIETKAIVEDNLLVGKKVRFPCDAFYHHNCRQILETQRQKIFNHFWSLKNNIDRYKYISSYVDIVSCDKNKNCNLNYFLNINGKRERVCQIMFESTLDINYKWIKIALEKGSLSSKVNRKELLNYRLKRSVTPDLISMNVENVADSLPEKTNTKYQRDPEIIELSNDSTPDQEEDNPRFEIVTVMELKKEEGESSQIVIGEPIQMETDESLGATTEESLNTPSEQIETLEPEIVEPEIETQPVEMSEHEIIEINSEEEIDSEEPPAKIVKIQITPQKKGTFCGENCKNNCFIVNNRRHDIFHHFWNIRSRFKKFEYLSKHVDVIPIMSSRHLFRDILTMELQYFLDIDGDRMRTCQEMFLSVLGINEAWVQNVLNYFDRNIKNVASFSKIKLNAYNSRHISETEIDSIVAFEAGLPYVTSKGTCLPGRKMRRRCNGCEFDCRDFLERKREEIFHNFWNISSRRKKYDFLWQHIKKATFEDIYTGYRSKQFFLEIYGELKEVCQTTFIATLDIDIIWVEKLEQLRNSVTY